jgi:hypothetical protein
MAQSLLRAVLKYKFCFLHLQQVHLPDKIYDFQFQPDLDDTDLETDELEPPQNISDEKKFPDSVILRSSPVRLTDQLANPDNICKPKPVNPRSK